MAKHTEHARRKETSGMVQAVLQTDGAVEVIVPDERLAAYDGVGALLRYRIS